ncbi:MAG: hypothetical protein WC216_04245 [Gallionella sp.]
MAPGWFGFSEISEGVYVDDKMPPSQQQQVLKTLKQAKERVSVFFGGIEGASKVFACSTEECFVLHGGAGAEKGKAYGKSMLLLSPRGLDAVIASHELTHIELCHRVGTMRAWYAIPDWFHEGLAVLVSEDPRYTEQAWLQATDNGHNVPNLEDIGKMLGNGNWQSGYGTASREVGNWYLHAGRTGLEHLIAEVKEGRDFDFVLNSIASASPPEFMNGAPSIKPNNTLQN